MTVHVNIWKEHTVDSGFVNGAVDALEETLDPQLNFDVDAYDKASSHEPFERNNSDWNSILDNFIDYVIDKHGCPPDKEYHMLIIDHDFDNVGAGANRGNVNGDWSPFKEAGCDNSKAAVGGANAATKAYENSSWCYGGHGSKAFKGTVIHEVLHGLNNENNYSMPSDDCDWDHSDEHSLGVIYVEEDHDPVSPLRLWYTAEACSANPPPCDTCNGNEDATADNIWNDELSRCEQDRTEAYASDHNL